MLTCQHFFVIKNILFDLMYVLFNFQDLLEYKRKQRILRVKLLDDSVKTLQVDDSHTVASLMITICSRIGESPFD